MHCPDAVIIDKAVFFDGKELPWFIAEDGVSFTPGGPDDLNELTLTFLVESATFSSEGKHALWAIGHKLRWNNLQDKVIDEYTDELFALLKTLHG